MAGVLAVLEQRNGALKAVSREVLAAARQLADELGEEVCALVIGPPGTSSDGLGRYGADRVLASLGDDLELYQADRYAQITAEQVDRGGHETVLLAATALGNDLGPRVAAKLGCPLASDVTGVSVGDGIVVRRPVYSGKAICTLRITQTPCVIALRPNVFTPIESGRAGSVEVLEPAEREASVRATVVRVEAPRLATLDASEASIVVSGGRGLRSPESFKVVEELAAALGGAVGASRAVVDAGWRPHSEQVGQTGKTVSPDLYIAVGISGAIQHLAGMRTAGVVVAINRDRNAPIFQVADYGIVGDALEIVPKLTEEIKRLREG